MNRLFIVIALCGQIAHSQEYVGEAPESSLEPQVATTITADPLLVPLTTNFWSYWDHYWTTWLPDHPKYEMIEVTVFEGEDISSEPLLRIILSERSGDHRQYFYLNDPEAVERSRANAYLANISYRREGSPGRPQSLSIEFEDKDGVSIDWSITFGVEDELRRNEGGLTPSTHSIGAILLFAHRRLTADTYDDSVIFDGVEYAHQGPADDSQAGIRSWYSYDYQSAVVIFGVQRFDYHDPELGNSWGRSFNPVDGDRRLYRSNSLGPENFVEIRYSDDGGMRTLSHYSHGRSLEFEITPALPPVAEIANDERFEFVAGFGDEDAEMRGEIESFREGDVIVLEWIPEEPDWATQRPFWIVIQLEDSGYTLFATDERSKVFADNE